MKFSLPIRIVILLSLCCLVGCSSSQDADYVKASNDSNIKKMGNVYRLFASRSGYTGPASMEELKSFLKTNEKITENLTLMGLERDKIDDYFISENDGKQFEFRWGVYINPDLERSSEPLVFEAEGREGVRLVMLANKKILEVDNDKKYQNLFKGKVSQDDATTDLEREAAAAAEIEAEAIN